ncbi:MAG: 50S ribosomal protein L29 [Bdellovibrionaceae bacterium]|jgi:large subunit ribosomal protein L29|nr:50S ribosomal protein L29 [Pseudobdellovibrionaceae bacterium]
MKFSEIKNLKKSDLVERLRQERSQLVELSMKNTLGRLENSASIRQKRRDIARLLTALNQGSKS